MGNPIFSSPPPPPPPPPSPPPQNASVTAFLARSAYEFQMPLLHLQNGDITYLCVKSVMALLHSFLPLSCLSSFLISWLSSLLHRRPPTKRPTKYFSVSFLLLSSPLFLSIGDQPTNRIMIWGRREDRVGSRLTNRPTNRIFYL